jgi:alpha-L-arabinofuranosidase
VNASDTRISPAIALNSKRKFNSRASLTILRSDNPEAFNSLDQPVLVAPVESEMMVTGKTIRPELLPNSVSLIRIKMVK